MAGMNATIEQWKKLKTQAESGDLRIDEEIGRRLRDRCVTLKAGLRNELSQVKRLTHYDGWGTLESAKILKTKFESKAESAPDSLMNQLKKHIEVVQLMEDTYNLAIRTLTDTDKSNAAKQNQLTAGLP